MSIYKMQIYHTPITPLIQPFFFKLYILYQYYKEPSMVFECVPVSGSLKLFAWFTVECENPGKNKWKTTKYKIK